MSSRNAPKNDTKNGCVADYWNSSLGSKSSSGPPPALLYFLLLGSKTLGSNNNELCTGAQGICEDFLYVSCAKGSNFCASFDGLGEVNVETSRGTVLEGA